MMLERIALVDDAAGAWITTAEGRRPAQPGEQFGLEVFAEALREHTVADVAVTDRLGRCADEPGTAIILPLAMLVDVLKDPDVDPAMLRRVLIAGSDRVSTLDLLERHRLAGAVEIDEWLRWQDGFDQRGAVMTGRRDVAATIGADVRSPAPFASEHYAPLGAPAHSTLPALVAAYLAAHLAECSDARAASCGDPADES